MEALGEALSEGGTVAVGAARAILDRAYGTPPQSISVSAASSKPTAELLAELRLYLAEYDGG